MSKETILFEDEIWKFLITEHEGKHVFFAKYIPTFINSGWKYFDDLKSCKEFAEKYISEYKKSPFNNNIQNH